MTFPTDLAEKLAAELGVPKPNPVPFEPIFFDPMPGETCTLCHRPMPPTALEVWFQQNASSYRLLARRLRSTTNVVYRLNHQAPSFEPKGRAAVVFAGMLKATGLPREVFWNVKPHSDPPDYACGGRKSGAR